MSMVFISLNFILTSIVSFIMVFTNHFSFIYYNSQANINTLIKTADYMMRSKYLYEAAEKTASFMICFSSHNLKCTVDLLYQHDAHHLVWEGHFTEG